MTIYVAVPANNKLYSGATITRSENYPGSAASVAALTDTRLGRRFRFQPTFYIHSATGGGVTRNDRIDFNRGGVLLATVAAGQYNATTLAAAIVTALKAADATPVWACSYNDATGKFTISSDLAFTLLFGTGANIATDIAEVLGFAAADTASATTHTGGSQAPNMGHFVKLEFSAPVTMEAIHIEGIRIAELNGLTTRPTTTPTSMTVQWYGHTSDLGRDPRLWAATATQIAFYPVVTTTTAPPAENEWVKVFPGNTWPTESGSFAWHYIYFDDTSGGDADNNFPYIELGYMWCGPHNQIGASSTPALGFGLSRTRTISSHASSQASQSSTEYGSDPALNWDLDLTLGAMSETERVHLLILYRLLGANRPALWITDAVSTAGGDNLPTAEDWAVWATMGGEIPQTQRHFGTDTRRTNAVLRLHHMPGAAPRT